MNGLDQGYGPETVECEAAASLWAIHNCAPNVRTRVITNNWDALGSYLEGERQGVLCPQVKGKNFNEFKRIYEEVSK